MAAGGLRMAYQALAKPVANLFKGASKTDLAMRFGPDVGYALMAGGMFAPENATAGERAAMIGEDLGYGVLSSIGGQLLGRRLGMGRAKAGLSKAKGAGFASPEDRNKAVAAARNTVAGYTSGGDMLGQMGMVMLPRPVSQGVYEAAGERANQSQEQIASDAQTALERELMLAAALGIGIPAAGAAVQRVPQATGWAANAMNLTA
jgi:hypothetical protein